MSIGSLVVSLEANIAAFTSSMDKASAIAEQRMQQIDKAVGLVKTSLAAVGAAAAVGLTLESIKAKIEGAIQSAAGLQELAERTGGAVEKLSGLAAVARLSGTDTDSLATGLQKLSKSMIDLEVGGKKSEAAFDAIGISVKDLKGLKPDEAFQLIAKRMDEYANGAEKTAIAQAIFGKAGANLLPVMKDLADVGDLQVKVTTAQAAQALEYEKNLKRLEAAQGAVFKVIAFQVLPVMDAFTKALLNSATGADGLKGAVDGLAQKGVITEWAQKAAIALATVAESIIAVIKLAGALAASFQAVWADLGVIGAVTSLGPQALFSDSKRAQLKAVLDERNKIVEDANKRYTDLWNYNGTALSTGLKSAFSLMNQGAGGGRGSGSDAMRLDRDKPTPNYVPPSGNGPKDDPAKAYMEGQIKAGDALIAAEKKQLSTREAYLASFYQQQYFSASEYYDTQKKLIGDQLTAELAAYDKELAAASAFLKHSESEGDRTKAQDARNKIAEITAKRTAAEADANERLTKVTLDAAKAYREFDLATTAVAYAYSLENAQAQFNFDMMGKSTLAVQQLTATRKIDLDLQQRIHEMEMKGYSQAELSVQIAKATIDAEAQKAIVIDNVTKAYDKQRDTMFGAQEALRKYVEDATNMGAQVENTVSSSFKGMEDALVNFVTTGKLSFSSLVNSIIADMARMAIQQSITGPLANFALGLFSGGGGPGGGFASDAALSNYVAGMRADGGPVNSGASYLVGERGPEIFTPTAGGRIIPNDQIGGGNGGGPTIIINNTIGSVASQTDVVNGMQTVQRQIMGQLSRSRNYAGAAA